MHGTLIAYTSEEQAAIIRENLPSRRCDILVTDCYTDMIAIPSVALLIDPDRLQPDEKDTLLDYYLQIDGCFAETVVFFGYIDLPPKLRGKMLVYGSFEELIPRLKYLLLTAYRKTKKSDCFNTMLSYGILILSEIRKHPGVTTGELSEQCEKSPRTIQRYIEALRMAGEWIEYDSHMKGWKLSRGKSILWGDVFE